MSVPTTETTGDGGDGGRPSDVWNWKVRTTRFSTVTRTHTYDYIICIHYTYSILYTYVLRRRRALHPYMSATVWACVRWSTSVLNTILYIVTGAYIGVHNIMWVGILYYYYIGASSCTYMYYVRRICAGEQRAAASCRFGCLNYHFSILRQRSRQRIRITVGFYSFVSFSLSSVYIYI